MEYKQTRFPPGLGPLIPPGAEPEQKIQRATRPADGLLAVSIMQPYLFPYIGYFQLIGASDIFVVYDNVQYIRRGWINRNRILFEDAARYIILPLKKDVQERKIHERVFTGDFAEQKLHILRQLHNAYRRAPYFARVMELIEDCFSCEDKCVATFVTSTLKRCCRHLRILTPFVYASAIRIDEELKNQDRILALVTALDAGHYINPAGGMALYDRQIFEESGLRLSFLQPRPIVYRQFDAPHVPWLSIIDVLMFNSVEATRRFLGEYTLS